MLVSTLPSLSFYQMQQTGFTLYRSAVKDCLNSGVGGAGGVFNSLHFVWYRRAAGIAPIFQVIYTSIGHDFFSNIHL